MRRSLLVLLVLASACGRRPPPVSAREQRAPKPAAQQLTPDVALARIQSTYRVGVQRCYQTRLKRDPAARGRVIVTFTVDDSGRLAYRHAKGEGRSLGRSIEDCVERAMARWSFPPPAEQTTFRLALRLSSRT